MTTSSAAPRRPFLGRLLLALGLALPALGIIGYIVQFANQRLTAAWYVPFAATLGVVCLVVSLGLRRTVWSGLALVLVLLLAAAEWAMVLHMRLPAYAGPVAAGKPFPDFKTARADGTSFTERDLEGNQDSVMVFFRGRW
jgi:hypothetical protein